LGSLTKDEIEKLPRQFETVPYSTFFKLWYAVQKSLPSDKKGEILTKIGRTIGKEFNEEGIETIEGFLERVQQFLEQEWAITDVAKVDVEIDKNGEVLKLLVTQNSCKMCFANTYYKFHDTGDPSCMFPQVIMGILSKVKNKFGFKNLRFADVQKGGVGECQMVWYLK
jgi:predicted hydrocarbon binding protein